MPKYFFLLSGEHPTLPAAELKAILEAEGIAYHEQGNLPQVLSLEADEASIEALARRAALTRVCCRELFCCPALIEEIIPAMNQTELSPFLNKEQSFAVRIHRVQLAVEAISTMGLERKLGALLKNRIPQAKINLQTPQRTFFGVLTDHALLFGLQLASIPPKPFSQRRPRKRPYFHPSAMKD